MSCYPPSRMFPSYRCLTTMLQEVSIALRQKARSLIFRVGTHLFARRKKTRACHFSFSSASRSSFSRGRLQIGGGGSPRDSAHPVHPTVSILRLVSPPVPLRASVPRSRYPSCCRRLKTDTCLYIVDDNCFFPALLSFLLLR